MQYTARQPEIFVKARSPFRLPVRSLLTALVAAACATPTPTGPPADGDPPPPAAVASVEVSATTDTLVVVGESSTLRATLRDAGGNVLTGRTVSWRVSNEAIATLSANQESAAIHADAPGGITVTAESEGATGSVAMRMIDADVEAFANLIEDSYTASLLTNATSPAAASLREMISQLNDALDARLLSEVRKTLNDVNATIDAGAPPEDLVHFAVLGLVFDLAGHQIAF